MSSATISWPRLPGAAAVALSVGAIAAAGVGAMTGSVVPLGVAVALLASVPVALAATIPWRVLVGALVCVIVFIPIRRYAFASGLPFQLEPYRLLVALLLAAWGASLLIDHRTRLRRTGFEGPIFLIASVALASILANPGRVGPLQAEVMKTFSFFVSFILILFFVATVIRTARDGDVVLKTLVASMAIVGLLAIVERRTGWSPFTELNRVFPLLHATADDQLVRGSGVRARGPAEHPIALGAALVLLIPISLYLANTTRSHRGWWWGAAGALAFGALATLSRTGILMLVVIGIVYFWLRTRETARLWPMLIPLVAVVHFALPGTLGSLKASFAPEGGLITQQKSEQYDCNSSGRIADIGPALEELRTSPLVGIGFGTRIIAGDEQSDPPRNACIFDDQWLATLLETGIAGVLAWLWFFKRLIGRLSAASAVRGRVGDLCVALCASIAAYAVSMFTYDAFGFVQVTFFLFLLAGVAASTLRRLRADTDQVGVDLARP